MVSTSTGSCGMVRSSRLVTSRAPGGGLAYRDGRSGHHRWPSRVAPLDLACALPGTPVGECNGTPYSGPGTTSDRAEGDSLPGSPNRSSGTAIITSVLAEQVLLEAVPAGSVDVRPELD